MSVRSRSLAGEKQAGSRIKKRELDVRTGIHQELMMPRLDVSVDL